MKDCSSGQIKIFLAFLLIAGAVAVGISFFGPSKTQNYAPEQPIPFSHKLHAGDRKIPCTYCHIGTENSRHATVPATSVCMNCHQLVKTDSPHIQKLTEMYNKGQPVPWVRVHNLPDFTFFNHRRHIDRGVQCQVCHGEVETMERVKQYAPLTMGWCVNCHRQPEYNAPTSCDTCHR
jgi:hypothetical protein